jgi:plastocyanin
VSNETLFYICGIALAASAVVVSFVGLRQRAFPGRLGALVGLYFVVLVGATATFAVLNAQDEQEARAAETASEGGGGETALSNSKPAERAAAGLGGKEATTPSAGKEATTPSAGKQGGGKQPAGGPGGTLQLAADPTQILFDKKSLSSKPGKVTIEFTNPSAVQHDVAIEKGGQELAKSPLIAQGKTSVSADLAPGSYTFLCTVPGHAEAGMEGTLTVK